MPQQQRDRPGGSEGAVRDPREDVSARLAQQVPGVLWALVQGFGAPEAGGEQPVHARARTHPQQVRDALVNLVVRLGVLLLADPRNAPREGGAAGEQGAGIEALYQRLCRDARGDPGALQARFEAWPALCARFGAVHRGGGGASQGAGPSSPFRRLFDPAPFPFLYGTPTEPAPRGPSDAAVLRVLEGLLAVEGERISPLRLPVEHLGRIYEATLGYEVCTAPGPAVALRPRGAVVDLHALRERPPAERGAWLRERTGAKFTGKPARALREARTVAEILSALQGRLSPHTPRPRPPGSLLLEPGQERRRTGAHYTSRALTEPVVREALAPVLAALGPHPPPERILALRLCDPALGAGAFLVEAGRQLARALVRSWAVHGPPADAAEAPAAAARRCVVERCLYGVDRNPRAVDLARLSLWLFALPARVPPSRLDHALRCGDALVGLGRREIRAFHWEPEEAPRRRDRPVPPPTGGPARAEQERRVGDLCVATFFAAERPAERERLRRRIGERVAAWRDGRERPRALTALHAELADRTKGPPVPRPVHWALAFGEVFERDRPGFDLMVGNPPFLGGKRISNVLGAPYRDWLTARHPGTSGNTDLVAHFFRAAHTLTREGGVYGFIATDTIAQGDTRRGGLARLCHGGDTILRAQTRRAWPGTASVSVSVVHLLRGASGGPAVLDGRRVPAISAFLVPGSEHDDPEPLAGNEGVCFNGCDLKGLGFLFADDDPRTTPLGTMHRILEEAPACSEVIRPYVGGADINGSPRYHRGRHVIDFGDRSEQEARRYGPCYRIAQERVRPDRLRRPGPVARWPWWRFWRTRGALRATLERRGLSYVYACSLVSRHLALARVPSDAVFSHKVGVFCESRWAFGAVMQSRVHEVWARSFSSTRGAVLNYSPSDCFETFPFPSRWPLCDRLHEAGEAYFRFRDRLMGETSFRAARMAGLPPEGLTATYNRFHRPGCRLPGIVALREHHAALDRAVLDAYGWTDLPSACDYEPDRGPSPAPSRQENAFWYRWPREVRDEVLSRLLALNRERAGREA